MTLVVATAIVLAVDSASGPLPYAYAVVVAFAVAWSAARVAQAQARTQEAERRVGAGAAKFEAVLARLEDGITLQDPAGRVVFANPVAARLIGLADASALVDTERGTLADRFDLFDEEGNPLSRDRLPGRAILEGRQPRELLLRYERRADGVEGWTQLRAHRLDDDHGNLSFVVNVFRDVSAPRRAEQRRDFLARAAAELSSSLDYAKTLAKVAELAVPTIADWCGVDIVEDGQVRRLAVAHVDPAKVALVREIEERWPPRNDAPHGVPNILRTGEPELVPVIPEELLLAGAQDAEHLEVIRRLQLRSYVGVPLQIGHETFGAITLVLAESKRTYGPDDLDLAKALAQRASIAVENARLYRVAESARAEAELASRTKDEFLAMLGHELRNPLAPIVTALEVMKLRDGAEGAREREVVARQVDALGRLVDDLLDVSRITRGRIDLDRRVVEIADVVDKSLEVTASLVAERGHALHVDVAAGLWVDGDGARLAQVFTNLLTNAAKYTEANGAIEITGTREGADVVVRVRDTGIGIDPQLIGSVFEAFAQTPQALDRARGGLGLGLTIVRSLVQLHGGRVVARSEGPGAGAVFEVRLPATDERIDAPTADREPDPTPAERPGSRILIVDDNADALEMMTLLLELLGHTIEAASDPFDALEIVQRWRPDVALLDLGLPGLDGYELARRLREVPGLAETCLVAVTGYGQPSDRERTAAAGFAAHLVKPVALDELRALLERLLPP